MICRHISVSHDGPDCKNGACFADPVGVAHTTTDTPCTFEATEGEDFCPGHEALRQEWMKKLKGETE